MRNWIRDNINQGNVLKMGAVELPEGSQIVTPDANITIARILDVNANMTITIDGSKSLPGDEVSFLIQATGAVTISFDGDSAPGSIDIGAGGVGAVKLINGGSIETPFYVSYVSLV